MNDLELNLPKYFPFIHKVVNRLSWVAMLGLFLSFYAAPELSLILLLVYLFLSADDQRMELLRAAHILKERTEYLKKELDNKS